MKDNMELKIKAIHFDASEKLEKFIEKKAEKLTRLNENVGEIEVTLKVVKPETANNKEAAVKVAMRSQADLFASKVANTFEEAVDSAIDALKPQLEKAKKEK